MVRDRILLRLLIRQIRMIKNTGRIFFGQDAQYRLVDLLLGHFALFHSFRKKAESLVPETHIHAGTQRQRPCLPLAARKARQIVNCNSVRHDKALKSHFIAQDIFEEMRIRMAVNAVNLIIRRHHPADALVAARLHGRKVNLSELPFPDSRSTGVRTACCLSLSRKMLRNHGHALLLEAAHRRCRHLRAQVRILRVTLLASSPARISQHIQHGYQRQMNALLF